MKQAQRLSNHKMDVHFLISANKENKGEMQLLNEHLKLSLIICLVVYGNHCANAFFFFSLQHGHDVGKKKHWRVLFLKKMERMNSQDCYQLCFFMMLYPPL